MTDIRDLRTHGDAYVTVPELVTYWKVHRHTIYKWIEEGLLAAVCFRQAGYRIRTEDARKFETDQLRATEARSIAVERGRS